MCFFCSGKVSAFEIVFRYCDVLSRLAYSTIALFLLKSYRKDLQSEYSNTEKFDYHWLSQIIIYSIITSLLLFFITIFNLSNEIRMIIGIYFSILIYVIGYKFIKLKNDVPHIKNAQPKVKYERSGLDEVKKTEIKEQLEKLMLKEKLYKETDINSSFLADKIGISQNHL